MEAICPKEKCTGCTACLNTCTHHAIKMVPDTCGFAYPQIDQTICVDCGLCAKICPVNYPLKFEAIKECYAVTVKDEDELLSCSSGGAATAFSRFVVKQGGVVYGCSGNNSRHVRHIRVDDLNDVDTLKGSKYVQSDLGDCFTQVKADLEHFPLVLFIGTPCQVAGLKNYLHKDYFNLITIDLVCHGVPSQKMLNDNLSCYVSDDEPIDLAFRRKNLQMKQPKIEFGLGLNTKNGRLSVFKPYNKDYYMFGFLRCLTFRENCYVCPYAQNSRVADLTLCDFWGLQPDAGFEMGKGVSGVLVNTGKGNEYFSQIKEKIIWKKRTVSEATRWNTQLNHPSERPEKYDSFIKLYSDGSFKGAIRKAYSQEYIHNYFIKYKNQLKLFLYRYHILRRL